jgi:hypothetical protein
MKSNDIVKYFQPDNRTGLRIFNHVVRLIRPVGTVPNFWEFQIIDGQYNGQIRKGFVYKEDQEDDMRKRFTVIEGGGK